MISSKDDYLYTDEATLERIKVNGDVLPLRNQHGTLRSEDIVFLNEALKERQAAAGSDPEKSSFSIPKIESRVIAKNYLPSRGSWHGVESLSETMTMLVKDESWSRDGQDISSDIASLNDSYNQQNVVATQRLNAAKTQANAEFNKEKRSAENDFHDRRIEIQNDYDSLVASENRHHDDAVKSENDDFDSDIASLKDQIESIKKNKDLSPSERRKRIDEKQKEIEERTLEHEETVYNETFSHRQTLIDLENERVHNLTEAQEERDDDIKTAEDRRDTTIRNAERTYESTMYGPKRALYSVCSQVLSNPMNYSAGTVSSANVAASNAGYKLPGEEAWDENVKAYIVDREHSAYYGLQKDYDAKTHQGLLFWGIYSDYEHMRVFRSGASGFGYYVMVGTEKHMPEAAEWLRAFPKNYLTDSYYVASRLGIDGRYSYYKRKGTASRFMIGVTSRELALNYANARAYVELEFSVSGEELKQDLSTDRLTDKTYRKVKQATVGLLCPRYHADIDSVDDQYEITVNQIEQERKEDIGRRKETYDHDVESENKLFEKDIKDLDDQMESEIESAREYACFRIGQIARDANTKALSVKDGSGFIKEGERQIQNARLEFYGKESDAKSRHTRQVRERTQTHNDELDELEAAYNADISVINDRYDDERDMATYNRSQSIISIDTRYNKAITDRSNKLTQDINDATDAAQRAIDALDPDDPGWYDAYIGIEEGLKASVDGLVDGAAADLNALDFPTPNRLYCEVDFSDIYNLGVDVAGMYGELYLAEINVRFAPDLKTLTYGDFARFDKYYEDATGPTEAQSQS